LGVEGDGFAEFIDARQHALQRTAWWLTGEWALAEDLVQAALVRSWPKWERIRRLDDPELYVRRVMVNLWASWSRRRWRKEQVTESVPDSHAPGDMAAEVTARLAVRSALGSLTARQRAVLPIPLPNRQTITVMRRQAWNIARDRSHLWTVLDDLPMPTDLKVRG
jgi:DNA-directed RNA polymerase specialized sigma24 family protein